VLINQISLWESNTELCIFPLIHMVNSEAPDFIIQEHISQSYINLTPQFFINR